MTRWGRAGAALGEFGQVPVRHLLRGHLVGQAVPDLFDQLQAFADAQAVDAQRFETDGHAHTSGVGKGCPQFTAGAASEEARGRALDKALAPPNAPAHLPRRPMRRNATKSRNAAAVGCSV